MPFREEYVILQPNEHAGASRAVRSEPSRRVYHEISESNARCFDLSGCHADRRAALCGQARPPLYPDRQQRRLIFLRRQKPPDAAPHPGAFSFYLILVRQEHHAALVGEGDVHHRHVGALQQLEGRGGQQIHVVPVRYIPAAIFHSINNPFRSPAGTSCTRRSAPARCPAPF